MRTIHIIFILYYVIIHSRASVFRDGVIEGCVKCCSGAYAANQDSESKCLTTLQNGYVGSYIEKDIEHYVDYNERIEKEKVLENDPEYKRTLQGLCGEFKKNKIDELLKLPEAQAKVKVKADKFVEEQVTTMKTKMDEICKYEMTISSGLTPEQYAFMIASALGQYTTDDVRKLTEYFKAQTAEKQQKIIDLTPSFWQFLYRHAPNFFDKLNDYDDMLMTEEFKTFLDKYEKWYPIQYESCKIEEVIEIYNKYKEKINNCKEKEYRTDMKDDIHKCAEAAAKNADGK